MDNTYRVEQHRHYVGYMDILGYKEYFSTHSEDTETFLKTINDAITETEKIIESYNQLEDKDFLPQIKLFSDNILIAIRLKKKNEDNYIIYMRLVLLMANIQLMFINKYQLFVRGAIAKGMLFFGTSYVFGDALIKAYDMESRQAIYPKIILDSDEINSIINYINQKKGTDLKYSLETSLVRVLCGTLIGKEDNGSYFVSYLEPSNYSFWEMEKFDIPETFSTSMHKPIYSTNPLNSKTEIVENEELRLHRKSIIERIVNDCHYKMLKTSVGLIDIERQRSIIFKYVWVIDYHNQACRRFGIDEYRIETRFEVDTRFHQPYIVLLEN